MTLAPGEYRRVQLDALEYRCARCLEVCLATGAPGEKAQVPTRCGACKTTHWNRLPTQAGWPKGKPRKPR